jgi:hypothetical protein
MTRAALAAVLLTLPLAASAQSDEGEYWAQRASAEARSAVERSRAEAAVRASAAPQQAAPAKPTGACLENPGLDGSTGFLFKIEGEKGIAMSFTAGTCKLRGTTAVREYPADQMGYILRVETPPGSALSWLTVVEWWPGRSEKTAATLGGKHNSALLSDKGLDLGAVTLSDTRGDAKTAYTGKSSLKTAQFSRGDVDEPKGCQ